MLDIRFDDLSELRSVISDEFSDWGAEVIVTQEIIQEFADITGDQQWIHVDVERAARGPFGCPIAHGLLTIALLLKLNPPRAFNIVGEVSRAQTGAESFRFLDTVPSGSAIHARSRITAVRELDCGTQISEEIHVHVVGNERPSLIYIRLMLYGNAVSQEPSEIL